jgi:hypothetical protein
VTGRLRSGALLWLLAVVTLALDGIALVLALAGRAR